MINTKYNIMLLLVMLMYAAGLFITNDSFFEISVINILLIIYFRLELIWRKWENDKNNKI
jgi:hypothetical protein